MDAVMVRGNKDQDRVSPFTCQKRKKLLAPDIFFSLAVKDPEARGPPSLYDRLSSSLAFVSTILSHIDSELLIVDDNDSIGAANTSNTGQTTP